MRSYSDLLDTYGLLGDPGLKIHLNAAECAPTAVEIVDFTAQPEAAQVRLRWETANELDIVGFRVLRAPVASPAGEPAPSDYVVMNEALIPATQAGAVTGGSYSYLDTEVAAGSTYRYRLESVGIDGSITRHETVEVATPHRWHPLRWLFGPHP